MSDKTSKSLSTDNGVTVNEKIESNEASDAASKEKQTKKASAEEESFASNNLKIESLQHFFGKRELEAFDNSEIMRTRFLWQIEDSEFRGCNRIVNKDTGKVYGVVPKMLLEHSWRMAHTKDAKRMTGRLLFNMTYAEWSEDEEKLSEYIRSNITVSRADDTVFVSDVWSLSEIQFEAAGLKHPQQFMALLKTAILGEIEQNRRLLNEWTRIKRYSHKVELASGRGGIFSREDVAKLSRLNVKYLNDIRKLDVFTLKNLLLEYDFERIVKDINHAFKEDLARRRDFRYKVYPFVAAFISLAVIIISAYKHQYTLIKNEQMTGVIMSLLTLCVLCAALIFVGGKRCKRRRFIRQDYIYYTPKVKKSIVLFAMLGLFSVLSVLVFYQRYDGYNSTVYYRDLDDGTIAIAGLRDDETSDVVITSHIDGKTVTEIDFYAFKGDDIESISLPSTLKVIDKSAFKKCEYLKSINIPSSVMTIRKRAFKKSGLETLSFATSGGAVTIEKGAFRECLKLKTVDNMSVVTSVGDNAFLECSKLTEFRFSEQLLTVGKCAFENCTSIVELYIPASVESIGKNAFRYCDAVKYLSIPYAGTTAEDSLEQNIEKIFSFSDESGKRVNVEFNSAHPIGAEAFKDISWIVSLSLGDKVTTVHRGAFANTSNLTQVKMSAAITEIYDSMFAGATSLKTVTGMSHVTSIKEKAFANCTNLTEIDLDAVENIAAGAFENCHSLISVGSLSKLVSVGDYAFANCEALSSISTLSSLNSVGSYAFRNSGSYSDLHIPGSLKQIGQYAFAESLFDNVVIGDGVKNIGAYAFNECVNLSGVAFPASLESIGERAFASCTSLYSVDLSNTALTSVGKYAFTSCTSLYSMSLNSSLTQIPEGMLKGCGNFDGIDNFNSLSIKTIGDSAFQGCEMSGTLTLPTSATSIGKSAFAGIDSDRIVVPSSVTSIGENAFGGCSGLISAELPFLGNNADYDGEGYRWVFGDSKVETLVLTAAKKVYTKTFQNGGNTLESVTLNEGVTAIESSAFKGLTSLAYVTIPSTVRSIGSSAFENCSSLTSVTLPASVTSIPKSVFKNCSKLRTVNFDSMNVTSIGEQAFCNTAFTAIEFNGSLVSVAANAFADCSKLYSVVFSDSMTEVVKNAFGTDPVLSITVVSEESYETYSALFEEYENINVSLRR